KLPHHMQTGGQGERDPQTEKAGLQTYMPSVTGASSSCQPEHVRYDPSIDIAKQAFDAVHDLPESVRHIDRVTSAASQAKCYSTRRMKSAGTRPAPATNNWHQRRPPSKRHKHVHPGMIAVTVCRN